MLRCIFVFAFFLFYLAGAARGAALSLAWDSNTEPDLAGYRVYVGTKSGKYGPPITVSEAATATVPDLEMGRTYYFVVTALNVFGMESLPSNEASFTLPRPPSAAGKFLGSTIGGQAGQNAQMNLAVLETGRFTGRITIGNKSAPIVGKLNPNGVTSLWVRLPGLGSQLLILQRDSSSGAITAILPAPLGEIRVTLRQSTYSLESPAPQAGAYTLGLGVLQPAEGSPQDVPPAWGVGSLVISKSGAVRGAGLLADGKPYAITSQLVETAEIPVYSRVYQGFKGVLAGDLRLVETTGTNDGDGTLWWQKPAQLNSSGLYSAGFNGTVQVQLSRWNRATPELFRLTQLKASLSGGNLPVYLSPLERRAIFTLSHLAVVNPGFDQLKVRVDPATGLLHGSFKHPVDLQWHSIKGAVLAKQSVGIGFFRGITETGAFELTVPQSEE